MLSSRKFPFIVFPLLIFPAICQCQQDEWQVYMNQFEKGPGTVLVNMAIKKTAPQNNFPYLVKAGIVLRECDEYGLPVQNEFEKLSAIDDSTWAVFKKLGASVHAGTFTYQCSRTNYYYVSDTLGIREKLVKMFKKEFPLQEPVIKILKDERWEAYLDFLFPNEETQEMISNQEVVMALSKGGDKLEKERQVDHWIYFNNEKDLECFIKYITAKAFKIESREKTTDPVRAFKLQISRTDKVDLFSITAITVELKKEAKKCNGDYDGWETFIVKE